MKTPSSEFVVCSECKKQARVQNNTPLASPNPGVTVVLGSLCVLVAGLQRTILDIWLITLISDVLNEMITIFKAVYQDLP
jgi:hypothetical protein